MSEWVKPRVGDDWTTWGDLPADHSKVDPIALSQDLYQAKHEDVCVDVGWHPEGDANGHFVCQRIHNANWDQPVSGLRTRDVHAVLRWIVAQTKPKSAR